MTPAPRFTRLQGQYLAFIDSYQRLHGRSPAEADFQRHFGVTPPSVHQMILTLERKALITRVPGAARSISLRVPDESLPPLGGKPRPDPAAEYIDSEMVTHRLRYRRDLSARIDGRYGTYRTRVRLLRRMTGDCTCPSDVSPCKHIRALRATWDKNPGSFLDLGVFLKSLALKDRKELIEAVGRVVLAHPQVLAVFGVPGFHEPEPDDEDWD